MGHTGNCIHAFMMIRPVPSWNGGRSSCMHGCMLCILTACAAIAHALLLEWGHMPFDTALELRRRPVFGTHFVHAPRGSSPDLHAFTGPAPVAMHTASL